MNKKILIATVFATLILLVPMTSVIGVSDTTEDCNFQPVSNLHLNRIERVSNRLEKLLNRLDIFTNIIPILFKNNPVVVEKYEDLSNEIFTLKEMNKDSSIICDIIRINRDNFREKCNFFRYLFEKAESEGNYKLATKYFLLWYIFRTLANFYHYTGISLGCWNLLCSISE